MKKIIKFIAGAAVLLGGTYYMKTLAQPGKSTPIQEKEQLAVMIDTMNDRLKDIMPAAQEMAQQKVAEEMKKAQQKIEEVAAPLVDKVLDKVFASLTMSVDDQAAFKKKIVALVAQQALNRGIQRKIQPLAAQQDQGFATYLTQQITEEIKKNPEFKAQILSSIRKPAVDQKGWTALHRAAYQDNVDEISALLTSLKAEKDKVAAINAQSDNGETSLHWAAVRGNVNAITALLRQLSADNKVKVASAKNKTTRQTPVHWAAQDGKTSAIHALLNPLRSQDKSLVVNTQDALGNTPLHGAVSVCRLDAITALLEQGARATITNNAGQTASQVAEKTCPAALEILRKAASKKVPRRERDIR